MPFLLRNARSTVPTETFASLAISWIVSFPKKPPAGPERMFRGGRKSQAAFSSNWMLEGVTDAVKQNRQNGAGNKGYEHRPKWIRLRYTGPKSLDIPRSKVLSSVR